MSGLNTWNDQIPMRPTPDMLSLQERLRLHAEQRAETQRVAQQMQDSVDAQRYRWLKERMRFRQSHGVWQIDLGIWGDQQVGSIDAAIDSLISSRPGEGE